MAAQKVYKTYRDFDAFVTHNDGKIFRYWVYKKFFTPYEMANQFIDQDCYEDSTSSFGIIKSCAPLDDGDYLIGIQDVVIDDTSITYYDNITYYKLS